MSRRLDWFIRIGFSVAVAILAIGAFLLPSPLVVSGGEQLGRAVTAAGVVGLGVAIAVTWVLAGRPSIASRAVFISYISFLVIVCYVTFGLFIDQNELPASFAAVVALFSIFSFVALCRFDRRVPGNGLLSFLLFLGVLACAEIFLQSMEPARLLPHVAKTPPLAERDRIETVYEKNGFRGKRPCRGCPESTIRIVTMGGSSTYGLPMASGAFTYASELQRMLDERRPNEKFEVLNAGVAGAGLTQILHGLRHTVLPLKPDVVSVCAWFNDNANSPGWYGLPGKSDLEAYKELWLLWKLQELPGYRHLHRTRLYGVFRHYLLSIAAHLASNAAQQAAPKVKRMSPAEFEEGLEDFVSLGKKHDFLPVFILEPLNRPASYEVNLKHNRYYAAMVKVAEKHGVPVVNAPELFRDHPNEWLFFDFIHPNVAGHKLVAEGLYQTLLGKPDNILVRAALEKRGVDLQFPELRRTPIRQLIVAEGFPRKIDVVASAPLNQADVNMQLEVRSGNQQLALLDGLTSEEKTFSIPVVALDHQKPIVDLSFRALPGRGREVEAAQQVGTTGVYSPVYLDVTSGGKDYGWQVRIGVSGSRVDGNSRGYNVAVMSSRTGEVLATRSFDVFSSTSEFSRLIDFVHSTGSYSEGAAKPIVVVAVKTDGALNTRSKSLAEALMFLGGTGARPGLYESFVLIGTPGAAPGTAVQQAGRRLVNVQIGDPGLSRNVLLALSELHLDG